jgi:hypothetical protein
MDALTIAASVALVLVFSLFALISVFGLMGSDSQRW